MAASVLVTVVIPLPSAAEALVVVEKLSTKVANVEAATAFLSGAGANVIDIPQMPSATAVPPDDACVTDDGDACENPPPPPPPTESAPLPPDFDFGERAAAAAAAAESFDLDFLFLLAYSGGGALVLSCLCICCCALLQRRRKPALRRVEPVVRLPTPLQEELDAADAVISAQPLPEEEEESEEPAMRVEDIDEEEEEEEEESEEEESGEEESEEEEPSSPEPLLRGRRTNTNRS